MLSLVSTPIGNLQDMTLRGLETLKKADYILCEDTRHSLKLMNFFGIEKPLYSLHAHNEEKKTAQILEDLKNGKHIALICDAGTPGICDPSGFLVKQCHENQIKVEAACGVSSLTAAISLFGLIKPHFQFLGFMPKETKEMKDTIDRALDFDGVSIYFDTPHLIEKTMRNFHEKSPAIQIHIAKELSKLHESIENRTPKEWLAFLETTPFKGEMVCLIESQKKEKAEINEEQVIRVLKNELDLPYNEMIRLASKILNQPKNLLYKKWL
jgi:16S rRNA (cytidine1402-2'-O)-methyltransferase